MTTVTKRRASAMTAGAKKAIAVVSAGALVASLGYFHLWGGTPAVAANDGDQIEVRFNLDNDVVVEVGSEIFDAQSEDGYQASVSEDLRFKASVRDGRDDRSISAVEAALQAATAQPAASVAATSQEEAAGETTVEAEADEESPEVRKMSHGGSDSSNKVIEIVSEDRDTSEASGASAENEPSAAAEKAETVEDEAIPMASTAGGGDAALADDQATEIVITFDADAGEYVITKDELQKAAAAKGTIEVTVTSEAQGETFDSWDSLSAFLSDAGADEAKAKLTADVTATSSIVVKGNKVLDLNGFTITSEAEGALFKVGDDTAPATFTINDSSSKYRDFDQSGEGVLVPKPNQGNAGDLLNGTMGKFREEWVGKKAEIDGDTLTYYVTRSYEDKNAAGVTNEYQIKHTVNMEKVGVIKAMKAYDLIAVDNGSSTLNIQGGRLCYSDGVKGDIHAVNLNKGGTLHMSGGFITGVEAQGLGGAISANNDKTKAPINITIDGTAVIAGNTTVKNGGAIWMSSEVKNAAKLTIGGDAVVAGNVAGEEPLTNLTKGTIATTRNGGAVYARKNCEVTVTGSAVISGNTANADGGGIYIEGHAKGSTATRNKLTIEENAMITNNRSENDRSSKHQTDRKQGPANEDNFWKNYGGGGGGVFTQDETIVNGGQITANFASDGGGGILALGGNVTIPVNWKGELIEKDKRENALPELKIESCRISSNYAGTSEGGGICAGTAKSSYIKSGIISNNMTATYFDYGGGGLFMSSIDRYEDKGTSKSTAGITVYHPLITGNTAKGFGGGVASCTNGVVMSCDAAVFDNEAQELNTTQNPNEFGDQWMIEGRLRDGEFKKAGQTTYGLVGNIGKYETEEGEEKSFANDFYCARKATVFNTMLGGGYYNWKGYTTGTVEGGEAVAEYGNIYPDPKYVQVNGGSKIAVTNVLYRSEDNSLTVRVPADKAEAVQNLTGYLVSFHTKDLSQKDSPLVRAVGLVTSIKANDPHEDAKGSDDKGIALYLDTSVDVSEYQAQATKIKLEGAYTTTPGDTSPRDYPMQKVNKLTETDTTCVTSDRLMFLTANPSDDDKQAARDEAVLFFTGNYSNTHGGGIACNDYIDVGAAGKEPPAKLEDIVGKMTISKKLTGWNGAEQSSATAVFNVTGYEDVEAYKANLTPIYVNQIGFTFNADDSAEKVLADLPLGYYVVEEVFYTGDNFKQAAGRNIWTVTLTRDNAGAGVSHEFTNNFKDENTFGTGVVNSYAPTGEVTDENGNITGFIYTDGKLTYTPDANYSKRKQPNAPIEGGN